ASRGLHVMLRQRLGENLKTLLRTIDKTEEIAIVRRNGSGIDQRIEVDDLVPVVAPVDDNDDLLRQFLGLRQGQNLKEFIESPESAREDHQRLCQIRKPVFTHTEVVELKVE